MISIVCTQYTVLTCKHQLTGQTHVDEGKEGLAHGGLPTCLLAGSAGRSFCLHCQPIARHIALHCPA